MTVATSRGWPKRPKRDFGQQLRAARGDDVARHGAVDDARRQRVDQHPAAIAARERADHADQAALGGRIGDMAHRAAREGGRRHEDHPARRARVQPLLERAHHVVGVGKIVLDRALPDTLALRQIRVGLIHPGQMDEAIDRIAAGGHGLRARRVALEQALVHRRLDPGDRRRLRKRRSRHVDQAQPIRPLGQKPDQRPADRAGSASDDHGAHQRSPRGCPRRA